MEFSGLDHKLLENIPEKERNEFFLRKETASKPTLGAEEFSEKRKKETPEDTEKYIRESERIARIKDEFKKLKEIKKIKFKDTYAAWRIVDIMSQKMSEEIPKESEEKLENETPEKTKKYEDKAKEILAKKGKERFDAMIKLKKNASPYVYWRVCNIICDLKNRLEK